MTRDTTVSIGLDIGHSATKLVWASTLLPSEHHTDTFPTFVTDAIELHRGASARAEMVEIEGLKYFYGDTARKQGRMERFTGLQQDWVLSIQHDVLVVAAFQRVLQDIKKRLAAPPTHFEVVVGLPSGMFVAHRNLLQERVNTLLAKLLSDGQSLCVRPQDQAFGPLQELMFNADGTHNTTRDLDSELWASIEVGQYSTDFSLFETGDAIEEAGGSCGGMCTVYERLAPMLAAKRLPSDFLALDMAIKYGEVRIFNDAHDVRDLVQSAVSRLMSEVIETAKTLFGKRIPHLTGLVLAGGGSPLLFDGIKEFIPVTNLPEKPRFSVAEGFCRLGLHAAAVTPIAA